MKKSLLLCTMLSSTLTLVAEDDLTVAIQTKYCPIIDRTKPVAQDGTLETVQDTPATVNVFDFVINNTGMPLELTEFSQGSDGTVEGTPDGLVTYTPNTEFLGADSFTYTVTASMGGSSRATIFVTVNEPPFAPQEVDDGSIDDCGITPEEPTPEFDPQPEPTPEQFEEEQMGYENLEN